MALRACGSGSPCGLLALRALLAMRVPLALRALPIVRASLVRRAWFAWCVPSVLPAFGRGSLCGRPWPHERCSLGACSAICGLCTCCSPCGRSWLCERCSPHVCSRTCERCSPLRHSWPFGRCSPCECSWSWWRAGAASLAGGLGPAGVLVLGELLREPCARELFDGCRGRRCTGLAAGVATSPRIHGRWGLRPRHVLSRSGTQVYLRAASSI